ncbi:MAG: LON peptidase substrate-binding domain-containing protein [Microbacterium sp.]
MNASPMFPLGSVLFPHTPLPLRIFEPRYLVMLGELLEDPDPEFGVVLIERGHEAGGGDQRLDIGTMARVVRVVAGEDDIQLVAIGRRRVTVTEWLDDDPYPRAVLETLPDLEWNDDYAPLLDQAERVVRRVLARAGEYGETRWDADTDISDEPIEAAWQLAAIAPLAEWDQFRLLRARTAGELLASLIDLTLAAEPGLTAAPVGDDFDRGLEELLRDEGDSDPGTPDER